MKKSKIEVLAMNSYVAPDPSSLLTQSGKYITNGVDNSYFYEVEEAYIGSPTNQAIIDNFTNYIIGEGLSYTDSSFGDVSVIISEEDVRQAVLDFKMQGACAFQVVYQAGVEKKIAKLYYLPTKSIAIYKQADLTDDVERYWYCFDWKNKNKFKPYTVPAFGYGENAESEILYIKRPSSQPLFALPDYQSGIEYCKMEQEMSHFTISHIQNNFSAGKVVNVFQAIEPDEDEQEEAESAILNKVKGTSNAGNIIIAFNKSQEEKTTVDNIEITDAYQQFEWISEESTKKIMLSHKVNDPALFGLPMPSGFSSQSEQLIQSMKILYRSQINPSRKILISALEKALKINDEKIKLQFVDFEELRVNKTEE